MDRGARQPLMKNLKENKDLFILNVIEWEGTANFLQFLLYFFEVLCNFQKVWLWSLTLNIYFLYVDFFWLWNILHFFLWMLNPGMAHMKNILTSPRATVKWVVRNKIQEAQKFIQDYNLAARCTTPDNLEGLYNDPE